MKPTLDELLRAWGHFYGQRPPPEWDESLGEPAPTGTHPIARAMEFAGGDESPSIRSAGAMRKIRHVPTWGFDPLVCTETRSHRISTPDDIPVMVQRMQRTWLELCKANQFLGTVLLYEYCMRGTQGYKAEELDIGTRVYRESLARALGWMESRLALLD